MPSHALSCTSFRARIGFSRLDKVWDASFDFTSQTRMCNTDSDHIIDKPGRMFS